MDRAKEFQLAALLQEYASLRAEVVERHNAIHMEVYVASAVVVAMMTIGFNHRLGRYEYIAIVSVISLAIVTGFLALWFEHRSIERIAARLRRIERKVNVRVGSDVMEWEQRWGGASTRSLLPNLSIPVSLYEDEEAIPGSRP